MDDKNIIKRMREVLREASRTLYQLKGMMTHYPEHSVMIDDTQDQIKRAIDDLEAQPDKCPRCGKKYTTIYEGPPLRWRCDPCGMEWLFYPSEEATVEVEL